MDGEEKRKLAAALAFNPLRDSAPQVVAKGLGLIAENILKTARAEDIPVYVDEALAAKLYDIEMGESIPPEMYEAVAEILIFIAALDREQRHPLG